SLQLAQTYGFGGIDFSIEEVYRRSTELGASAVKRLFEDAGLQPGSWNPPVDWRGDEANFASQLTELPKLAALAQQLRATHASTWVPPASDERPFDENFEFHARRFRPIAEILRDHGCRLGLEFIGPKTLRTPLKYAFIYNVQGMLELC